MTSVKAMVRNGRIELPAPSGIPDGTVVTLTIAPSLDEGPLPPEEIARILAAMEQIPVWDIPDTTAAELDAWEGKINQRAKEHQDPSMENVFP